MDLKSRVGNRVFLSLPSRMLISSAHRNQAIQHLLDKIVSSFPLESLHSCTLLSPDFSLDVPKPVLHAPKPVLHARQPHRLLAPHPRRRHPQANPGSPPTPQASTRPRALIYNHHRPPPITNNVPAPLATPAPVRRRRRRRRQQHKEVQPDPLAGTAHRY